MNSENRILQPTDIAWLKANFDVLKLIPKEQAAQDQVLVWDKKGLQGQQLSLLTTNNVA